MRQEKSTLEPLFLRLAKFRPVRVAIGVKNPTASILHYLKKAYEFCTPVLVGATAEGFECFTADRPHDLLFELLKESRVEAIIRGQVSAEPFRAAFAAFYQGRVDPGAAFVAVTEDAKGRVLLLSPVTNPRGWDVADKIPLVEASADVLTRLGLPVKVAVLSYCRQENFDEAPVVMRQSHLDADALVEHFTDRLDIRNYGIDFDIALAENANVIIEPNGGTGNQVLRSLAFLDALRVYGVPILNADRTIVESMRNSDDFSDHLLLAAALENLRSARSAPCP